MALDLLRHSTQSNKLSGAAGMRDESLSEDGFDEGPTSKEDAKKRELQPKKSMRAKKLALIRGDKAVLNRLNLPK